MVRDGDLFARILDFYQSRMDARQAKRLPTIRAFVLVKVARALPLISPAYDDGTDEISIRDRWISYYSSLHQQTVEAGEAIAERPKRG